MTTGEYLWGKVIASILKVVSEKILKISTVFSYKFTADYTDHNLIINERRNTEKLVWEQRNCSNSLFAFIYKVLLYTIFI